jgi:hypothetical protein
MAPRGMLGAVERAAWLRTFEDGIWDIVLGLVLLGFGLSVVTGMTAVLASGIVAGLVIVGGIKRRVAEPRIGRVCFSARRRRQLGGVPWLLAALSAAGVLVLLFLLWTTRSAAPDWAVAIRDHFLIVIGVIWGGAAAFGGWWLELRRLYLYAALITAALVAADLGGGLSFATALLACGGAIALCGAGLLLRFLRRYPRRSAADDRA